MKGIRGHVETVIPIWPLKYTLLPSSSSCVSPIWQSGSLKRLEYHQPEDNRQADATRKRWKPWAQVRQRGRQAGADNRFIDDAWPSKTHCSSRTPESWAGKGRHRNPNEHEDAERRPYPA